MQAYHALPCDAVATPYLRAGLSGSRPQHRGTGACTSTQHVPAPAELLCATRSDRLCGMVWASDHDHSVLIHSGPKRAFRRLRQHAHSQDTQLPVVMSARRLLRASGHQAPAYSAGCCQPGGTPCLRCVLSRYVVAACACGGGLPVCLPVTADADARGRGTVRHEQL